MACCADNFDAALVGLVVGFCADEGGEERVVDINDIVGELSDELVANDLHVPGEDDE